MGSVLRALEFDSSYQTKIWYLSQRGNMPLQPHCKSKSKSNPPWRFFFDQLSAPLPIFKAFLRFTAQALRAYRSKSVFSGHFTSK
jgi:hypothetical protein